MKNVIILAVFVLTAAAPGAPRLESKPHFTSTDGEAYRVLIGPTNLANTELKVTFAVQGRKGATYTVELYVEANSTGEKAEWLRTATVKLDGRPGDEEGRATGEFKARCRLPDQAESADRPHLPFARRAFGYSYILLIREGKQIVGSIGPTGAQFVDKDVHVRE
jgi:hypothetical protein